MSSTKSQVLVKVGSQRAGEFFVLTPLATSSVFAASEGRCNRTSNIKPMYFSAEEIGRPSKPIL